MTDILQKLQKLNLFDTEWVIAYVVGFIVILYIHQVLRHRRITRERDEFMEQYGNAPFHVINEDKDDE